MTQEYIPPKLPIKKELESKKVLKKIVSANRVLAELKGVAQSIPNQSILINSLALQEAKDSSEIENIVTTHDELYRANAGSSHISNQAKEVGRYKDALYIGFELIKEHKVLLKKHIVQIQKVLENNDAGIRSQSGTSLKNSKTGEVTYMPPQNYKDIQNLMDNLEKYINTPNLDEFDTLLKMAIVHYQFESIHPFYDGNGRTGRIINILFLILSDLLELPILYLSSYIIKTKNEYYRLLNEVRIKESWEEWILYMLEGVEVTARNTIKIINEINYLIHNTKEQLTQNLPKVYSKDLLELLFKHPYTKISFLVDELNITRKTASVHLREIEKLGILQSIKVGRDVYFINKELFKILKTKY
ncbi:MAG: Addiction module protein [uncultured Campylobacterales bacterium]|uniref:Addiction module protein n=1 Tax=uncultured Campylobacterales bacterium TaxID=352960 RepID=A0A6S6SB09_9BACT|nr:MAG: Addiction module protein [uncultured Campylobacterales bacterium]